MKIYSVLQIGDYHVNHCEDYLFVGDIADNKILCAVMDGCTMATDSYFISTLAGKLLRKIAKEKSYKELYNLEKDKDIDSYLKSIVKELFKELNSAKNQLMLDQNELLTTIILLLFDKKTRQGIALVIGDGFVSINGNNKEFDQDNKPDYLGYHLNEPFEAWYDNQQQKIILDDIQDLSIATDGIFTFNPIRKIDGNKTINPIDFLAIDNTNAENEDMLNLKLKKLEHNYGLKPGDDFGMIRIIF